MRDGWLEGLGLPICITMDKTNNMVLFSLAGGPGEVGSGREEAFYWREQRRRLGNAAPASERGGVGGRRGNLGNDDSLGTAGILLHKLQTEALPQGTQRALSRSTPTSHLQLSTK